MTNIGDLFSDFSRIDTDIRGGYARVARVKTRENTAYPEYCAFKLMRHELDNEAGLQRFGDEICNFNRDCQR